MGASVIAFGFLAISGSLSGEPSPAEQVERVVSGVAIATFAVSAVILLTIFKRSLFVRSIRRSMLDRPDALMHEVMRSPEFMRVALQGDVERVPRFLALIADRTGVEVWGGIASPRIIWSSDWPNVSDLRIGGTFDGRQAYECLELQLLDPANDVVPFVVTGRGWGGMGAIEGEPLQGLAIKLNDLRRASAR
jgi:hypothetical protein